jgi:hypothetical protein
MVAQERNDAVYDLVPRLPAAVFFPPAAIVGQGDEL